MRGPHRRCPWLCFRVNTIWLDFFWKSERESGGSPVWTYQWDFRCQVLGRVAEARALGRFRTGPVMSPATRTARRAHDSSTRALGRIHPRRVRALTGWTLPQHLDGASAFDARTQQRRENLFMKFEQWFSRASGHDRPRPWQVRLADDDAPRSRLVRIPTGQGKTLGVLAAWAWHRVARGDQRWPRRLVWCLPMRVLRRCLKRGSSSNGPGSVKGCGSIR